MFVSLSFLRLGNQFLPSLPAGAPNRGTTICALHRSPLSLTFSKDERAARIASFNACLRNSIVLGHERAIAAGFM